MKVATLGPSGTHSELALRAFLPAAEPLFCTSISDVFRRVASGEAESGFVPRENVIQGPVSETLDELFEHKGKVFADSATVYRVHHAIGVAPKAEWPRKIARVLSHEQALRQCAGTIERLFPGAELCPYPSTTAALGVLTDGSQTDVAIVAPADTLKDRGLLIVADEVSDNPDNKTRFVGLKRGDAREAMERATSRARCVTSIVIDPGRDRKGLLFEIIQILSVEHRINLNSIHSRPDNRGGFVFHLDLEGHPREPSVAAGLKALDDYCRQATGATAEVVIVGFHDHQPFFSLPFDSIGIVGGLGRMGRWFSEFFESVGIRVLVSDVDSGIPLPELCQAAKVILLSVPMSQARGIASEICRYARPGQLLIENCSIKDASLTVLEREAPDGVEVLGMHTMFGEKTPSFRGENVVLTKTARSGPMAQSFENLLYKHGAHIYDCTAEEHDQVTAVVQSLLQLSLIIVGDVASRALPRRELLKAFSTPNFRLLEQALVRVINQTGQLTSDLQLLNPRATRVRHQLLESACRHVFALEQQNGGELRETLERLRVFFADKAQR